MLKNLKVKTKTGWKDQVKEQEKMNILKKNNKFLYLLM